MNLGAGHPLGATLRRFGHACAEVFVEPADPAAREAPSLYAVECAGSGAGAPRVVLIPLGGGEPSDELPLAADIAAEIAAQTISDGAIVFGGDGAGDGAGRASRRCRGVTYRAAADAAEAKSFAFGGQPSVLVAAGADAGTDVLERFDPSAIVLLPACTARGEYVELVCAEIDAERPHTPLYVAGSVAPAISGARHIELSRPPDANGGPRFPLGRRRALLRSDARAIARAVSGARA